MLRIQLRELFNQRARFVRTVVFEQEQGEVGARIRVGGIESNRIPVGLDHLPRTAPQAAQRISHIKEGFGVIRKDGDRFLVLRESRPVVAARRQGPAEPIVRLGAIGGRSDLFVEKCQLIGPRSIPRHGEPTERDEDRDEGRKDGPSRPKSVRDGSLPWAAVAARVGIFGVVPKPRH